MSHLSIAALTKKYLAQLPQFSAYIQSKQTLSWSDHIILVKFKLVEMLLMTL